MLSEADLDVTEVHPGLWVGAYPPGLADLRLLAGWDEVVVCMPVRVRRRSGPRAWSVPMVDGHGPVPECIFRAARRVSRALRRGRRVLLLCVRGRNRSGLLAALAMSYLTGASGRECARRVSRARHMALTNQAFGVLLDQFSPG